MQELEYIQIHVFLSELLFGCCIMSISDIFYLFLYQSVGYSVLDYLLSRACSKFGLEIYFRSDLENTWEYFGVN